jgi:hypothetical protein
VRWTRSFIVEAGQGDEREWDFTTHTVVPKIDWPQDKLNRIVELVADLEKEPDMSGVINACIPERPSK